MKNHLLLRCVFIFLALCFASVSFAQLKVPPQLAQRLQGKKNFYTIKQEVLNFFKTEKQKAPFDSVRQKNIDRDLKKWNRWFYESESRLNAKGEVENVAQKIFDEVQNGVTSKTTLAYGSWNLVGPTFSADGVGRASRIAFDPNNPQVVYAGTAAGGLWKTVNGGTSWANLSSFIPSLGVGGIVISHNNSNVIYVLTGEGDAHLSGGFTFSFGYIRFFSRSFKINGWRHHMATLRSVSQSCRYVKVLRIEAGARP